MKVLGFLAAAAVLLVLGCAPSSRQEELATSRKVSRVLALTTNILRKIAAQPNEVPDAVLNVTKCVAVFPQSPAALAEGTLSCRETHDQWLAPRRATLAMNSGSTGQPGDLLVFVVGDAAVRLAQMGRLNIERSNAARGPTLHDNVTVTDADLKHDVLIYHHIRGRVDGFFFTGQMRTLADKQNGSDAESFTEAVTAYFNSITPVGIIVHHSATLRETHNPPSDVRELDRFHSERGFAIFCEGKQFHVAYHYLILPDGKVQSGRPERCEGAHSEGYNSYLGISLVGDFSSKDNPHGNKGPVRPSAQQLAALEELSRRLMAKYRIPLNRVLRHSDVARTECPGDRFPFQEFLRKLQ